MKKKISAIPDPFDAACLARPRSEKSLVCNLLPVFHDGVSCDEVAQARAVLGRLRPEMFADQAAADAVAAMQAAIVAEPPTMTDLCKAVEHRATARGVEAREIIGFIADVGNKATSWRAAGRLAEEAAGEVVEVDAKRQAMLVVEDTVRALKSDTAGIETVRELQRRLDRVTDAMEQRDPDRGQLVMVRASEIEVTPINWLWPQRIVGDGLTIVTGPVGISKSLISVDVAARVTTGGKWPDGTGHAPLGSVLMFGAEDDPGKVVVPRLMAAGADLSRVLLCQGATTGRKGGDEDAAAVVLERHIGQLRAALDKIDDCRLIVFDPLPDYMAADENNSSEVRAALMPLARLAQERNVAVLAVAHQNKKNDLTTVQRIAGSSAFAQVARTVLAIGTHPEDVDKPDGKRRVMLVSKNNYGERDVGQAYEIETRASGLPGLVWHPGRVSMDADQLSRRPTGGQEHEDRRGAAVDALREMLALGEKNCAAVTEELQDRGFRRRQIDHAATALNVKKRKQRDGWYWRLPRVEPGAVPKAEPDPAFAAFALDATADGIEEFNRT